MLIKNKKLYFGILLFLGIYFFVDINKVIAANINFSPSSGTYHEGDLVEIKINVSSEKPINAVSSTISFPSDVLSIASFSKDSSIINLWVQEPTFSNDRGTINFGGVILNGYNGDSGNILTLIFKAKSDGKVTLKFSSVSILANDGNGTDIFSGDLPIGHLNIEKEINTNNYQSIISCSNDNYLNNKPQNKAVSKLSVLACMAVNVAEKTKEIEINNHLIGNSLLVAITILFVIIISLILIYFVYFIIKLKKYFKHKLQKIDKIISSNFKDLEKDIDSKTLKNDRIKAVGENGIINEVVNTEGKIIKEIKEDQ